MSLPDISLVIPVFNEEENLEILAGEIRTALEGLPQPYEVLFIDDGSSDSSAEILDRLAATDPRLRIFRMPRNCGQSAAFAVGFREARGEVIVTLDADLQNDPADIPRLLAEIGDYDVVCGVRSERHDSWVRRASSRIANTVRNWLTGESITDVGCSLRAFRSSFASNLPMFTGMHRFLPTLLRMEGARIKEVPVAHRPRVHGESKYNINNRLWAALADLRAVRWMLKRWIRPDLATEVGPGVRERTGADAPGSPGDTDA